MNAAVATSQAEMSLRDRIAQEIKKIANDDPKEYDGIIMIARVLRDQAKARATDEFRKRAAALAEEAKALGLPLRQRTKKG